MTERNTENQSVKPGRTRWRWLRRSALVVLVLILAFHRPLLQMAVREALLRFAASQHVRLAFEIEGPVLNGLVLKNVRGVPDGQSHLNNLRVEEIRLRYSLWSLLRRGPADFLKSCELRNTGIEITPVLPGDHPEIKGPGRMLHDFLEFPLFMVENYSVENLVFVSHTPDGDFIIEDVNTRLGSDKVGFIRIGQLKIPKLHTWNKIDGAADYKNHRLVLRDVNIDGELRLVSLELYAGPDDGLRRIKVQAEAFGGTADILLSGILHGEKCTEVQFSAHLENTALDKGFAYFSLPLPANGNIRDFSAEITGDPDSPDSWKGTVSARIESGMIGAAKVDHATVKAATENGLADGECEINTGGNILKITARTQLSRRVADLPSTAIGGALQFSAGNLALFNSHITKGRLSCDGKYAMHKGNFSGQITASAKDVDGTDFSISQAGISGECSVALDGKMDADVFIRNLQTRMDASFQGLRSGGYLLDSGSTSLASSDGRVTARSIELKRGGNTLTATVGLDLPKNPANWLRSPFDATFSLDAPDLNSICAEPSTSGLSGQISAQGNLARKDENLDGRVTLTGTKLNYGKFSSEKLDLNVLVAKNAATIETFSLALNSTDGVSGSGHIELRKPFTYDGKLKAGIRDLSVFNSLLQAAGVNEPVAGSLDIDWQGGGKASLFQHSGSGSIRLQKGRFGALQPVEAEISGNYSPEAIDFPTFKIEANQHQLEASVAFRNAQLAASAIKYSLNKKELVTGSVTFPLNLRTPAKLETLIPTNAPVSASLATQELPVESLAPGRPLPVKGTAAASLTAQGSLDHLEAALQLRGRNLQPTAAVPKLAPASLDLDFRLQENRLALSGTMQQQDITPLKISGEIPFPVLQILREKKIDGQSPVRLDVKLSKTSMAFLARLIPGLRFVEGEAGMDAGVAGTVAKPEMHGSAQLDLRAVRFQKPDWPAINGFKGDLVFSGNKLTVNRCGGEISGGSFNLAGNVLFVTLLAPVLDLRLTSQGALLARNETLMVRADSDVKIRGPFTSASVTGEIELTKSKFFREIELIPIQLPGRPAPKPPETIRGFSFTNPPLRDWKFDLSIKTKDPFLIHGNLANGSAEINLKLAGTGFAPTLDGSIRIENFTASLPFSSLDVTSGFVYFNAKNPFIPTLDIQAVSSLQDYNISAYIYGDAANPQTILSSEPPLPQEDILALLATGATPGQLSGNTDALAGRAAILVLQQLYFKVFKHSDTSGNNTFLNRFKVDVGGVDPRTGRQELSTRFKLTDKFYLIGSLDVQGDIRGEVKYLLQFR